MNTKNNVINPAIDTIYCHFSFKRPKGQNYGLFAIALYSDFAGKKLILHKTRKYPLWENHQFITAIQSYEHALLSIYEIQGQLKASGITQVMLVTDNSTLAGWIENPKKNKKYTAYMERAVKAFRAGSYKEIVLGVGLCEPRDAEKSYKYCKEELVSNEYKPSKPENDSPAGFKFDLGGVEYKSALSILEEDGAKPTIVGMDTLE